MSFSFLPSFSLHCFSTNQSLTNILLHKNMKEKGYTKTVWSQASLFLSVVDTKGTHASSHGASVLWVISRGRRRNKWPTILCRKHTHKPLYRQQYSVKEEYSGTSATRTEKNTKRHIMCLTKLYMTTVQLQFNSQFMGQNHELAIYSWVGWRTIGFIPTKITTRTDMAWIHFAAIPVYFLCIFLFSFTHHSNKCMNISKCMHELDKQ